MFPLFTAIFSIIFIYFLYRTVIFFTDLYRRKTLANKLPRTSDEHPIWGVAPIWAKLDTAGILEWELKNANELRDQGHDVWCLNFAHENFILPLTGESIKPILESKNEITKGLGYDYITEWLGTGLLISKGEKWQQRRKLITPTFHFRHLENYVKTFNNHSKIFVEVVSELNGEEFDAVPYIKRCALDVICDAAMGATADVQHNPSHPYVMAIRDMLWINTEYMLKWQYWFPPYYYWSGMAKLYKNCLNILHTFTKKIIAERKAKRANGEKTRGTETNFLDMLLEHYDAGEIDDEGVREEVDTFMFEGHDTTSSGVSWAIWCIAHHPKVQQKLYNEILEVIGEDQEEIITTEHLKKMTYLDQVMKEVFRLYCPVPQVNRRLQEDFQSGPYLFPKGAVVTIAPILLARNKKVWGDDVLSFDPERFSEERESKRHPFDYIPFSAGPRNCIGQRFAQLEAKVMVCWLVRAFDFSSNLPFESNRAGTEAVLRPMSGIPIFAKRRI
ncbi:unnamed protein product, partial [Mesorhabditis belari]|uniref:Cytochrome P450 n=1 Tax=Mesorhabditis belari TaxID=2138241 RepID=A0AAF3EKI3_9BILA